MDAAARRGAERERLRERESQAKTADGQIELSTHPAQFGALALQTLRP